MRRRSKRKRKEGRKEGGKVGRWVKEERRKFQVKPSLPPLEIRGFRSQCHRCHLLGHETLCRKKLTVAEGVPGTLSSD